MITKNATHLTTDDLRMYLTEYQKINNCSKASIDNIRRNLSSFFSCILRFWFRNREIRYVK